MDDRRGRYPVVLGTAKFEQGGHVLRSRRANLTTPPLGIVCRQSLLTPEYSPGDLIEYREIHHRRQAREERWQHPWAFSNLHPGGKIDVPIPAHAHVLCSGSGYPQ